VFNELVESVSAKTKTNTRCGVLVSLSVQSACLVALILIPLIRTRALPRAIFGTFLVAPAPPPSAPPPAPASRRVEVARRARFLNHNVLTAPLRIPEKVRVFREEELPPEAPAEAENGEGFAATNLLRGFDNSSTAPATPPPPPANTMKRIQLGGNVQAAKILAQPQPTYPALAVQARIEGNVVLHAIIDREGRVSELQVVSGHPLLVQAALDAVRRWRYQPTELNHEPVEVDTTITVSFVLGK
jgi:protein TonB